MHSQRRQSARIINSMEKVISLNCQFLIFQLVSRYIHEHSDVTLSHLYCAGCRVDS